MQRGRLLLIMIVLTAVTVAAYARATSAGFLYYDDGDHVYANEHVTSQRYSDILTFWKAPYLRLYIPLTYTVWSLEAKSSSRLRERATLDPRIFHATNVAVHILAALAVFGILLKVGNQYFASACGASLFALHPLQVESVAWISELKGLLGGFFCFASLLLYIHAITLDQDGGSRAKRSTLYLGAILVSLLGLLSKPSAVVTPLLAGLCALCYCNRAWRQTAREIFPWLMLVIPFMVYTTGSQPDQLIDFIPPLLSRVLIAGDAISFYVYKLFVPFPLGIDYGRFPQAVLQNPWIWLTGTLPFAVAAGLLLAGLKYQMKPVNGAVLIFITALLPALGMKPFDFQHISTVADRYVYIAMLGPALMVSFLLARYRSTALKACAVSVLTVLFALTWLQVRTWQNNDSLLSHTLAVNPRSIAYQKCMVKKAQQEGDLDGVAEGCRRMMAINDNASFHNLLGDTLQRQGKLEEARHEFLESLRINPRRINTYELLGALSLQQGDHRAAVRAAYAILERDRFNAKAYNLLGLACWMQGRKREAVEHLLVAQTLEPDQVIYSASLAHLYESSGEMEKAIAVYREALARAPNNEGLRQLLAQALKKARQRRPDGVSGQAGP